MAEKNLDRGARKKQELDDITTCCICTEVCTNPKALPCVHTFCMKCLQENGLKTNKGPGDEMPCPMCRQLFKIPLQGFHGLPKNFIIENLIQFQINQRLLCDACIDKAKEETGKEIPTADTCCVDCNQKFCEECGRLHGQLKLTKNHVMTEIEPRVCVLHEQNILNVYCADCKTVVCAICFIDEHKNHEGTHVKKFVDGFLKQIESNAEAINECRSKAEMTKAEILKVNEGTLKMFKNIECDVEKRRDELKEFTDKHATSLLQCLDPIIESKLKEIQMARSDIDTYLSSLEAYNSYCLKIMAKGSASDICRAFSDLSARAVELKQQCQPMIEKEIQSFNLSFSKSEVEEILEGSCENWIGEIEEVGDSRPKKRSKESLLAEQSKELVTLRKLIEIESAEKERLLLSNEKLKKELDARNIANNSLQTNVDQLKQELKKEKIANNLVQTDKDKLKQELDKEKMSNNSLHDSSSKIVQEVNMYKTMLRASEDRIEKLKQELETTKTDKLRYKSDPVLDHTIRIKAAEEGKRPIVGLTILDKELFIVGESSSEVEIYDSIKFSFNRRLNLKELIDPMDIVSCSSNKCLYISDYKIDDQANEILRVDPNGKLIKKWSTGGDYGWGLSVTDESNVILTVNNGVKLNEYSPDGELVREVILSSDAGIFHPKHAIKLSNGHFVVGHGESPGDLRRVCMVDADGKLKKSFGGKRGSSIELMNSPVYLAVDGNGFVIAVDEGNSRILLLNPELEFQSAILSKAGILKPFKILLDELNGRLFVADNGRSYGQIFIFLL